MFLGDAHNPHGVTCPGCNHYSNLFLAFITAGEKLDGDSNKERRVCVPELLTASCPWLHYRQLKGSHYLDMLAIPISHSRRTLHI
jgi:hypothetical protein